MASSFGHIPVLLHEAMECLAPRPKGIYVDGTVGGGGHAERLMELVGGDARLIGIDQDPEALAAARERLERFAPNVTLVRGNFRNIGTIMDRIGVPRADGILFDVGVSSHQLDRAERGFSYRGERLDMRMDPDATMSAADLLATADEEALTRILWEYGEERWASRIARFIVKRRESKPIAFADELVDVIKEAVPTGARRGGPHPARRTFQALRIAVNDELGALQQGLGEAVDRLSDRGRLAVISFHSLEDRIVKRFMRDEARGCECPPDLPVCACGRIARLRILTKRPVAAGEAEVKSNPRSRSAKLRAAERINAERESE